VAIFHIMDDAHGSWFHSMLNLVVQTHLHICDFDLGIDQMVYIYIYHISLVSYIMCVCQPRGVATGRNNGMNEIRQNVAILFVRSLHCLE
jgi:hypothetical protein